MLAAAAAADDELGRLGDGTWKTLLEGGFLRSLQPRRWGGGEVRFVEFVDAMIELSAASPSHAPRSSAISRGVIAPPACASRAAR